MTDLITILIQHAIKLIGASYGFHLTVLCAYQVPGLPFQELLASTVRNSLWFAVLEVARLVEPPPVPRSRLASARSRRRLSKDEMQDHQLPSLAPWHVQEHLHVFLTREQSHLLSLPFKLFGYRDPTLQVTTFESGVRTSANIRLYS